MLKKRKRTKQNKRKRERINKRKRKITKKRRDVELTKEKEREKIKYSKRLNTERPKSQQCRNPNSRAFRIQTEIWSSQTEREFLAFGLVEHVRLKGILFVRARTIAITERDGICVQFEQPFS